MKYILLFLLFTFEIMAATLKVPIVSVDNENETLTIKIGKIDVGMSGYVVHNLAKNHEAIIANVVVKSFDANSSVAVLNMTPFYMLDNDSVPSGKWSVEVGDSVELAFGYSRALLIAPNEEIYYRVTKSTKTQWIHPDMFATILSFTGHPSPLKSDFNALANATSVGLLFIYLDKKIYTLDIKSFKILAISDAPLEQKSVHLPFYTRIEKIESSWWDFGEGSDKVKAYEPYYYKLLIKYNQDNQELLSQFDKFEKGK